MKIRTFAAAAVLFTCVHAIGAEFDEFVRVIEVSERTEQVRRPRSDCGPQPDNAADQGERGLTGTVVGGIAGGLLGNQVGKGNGKTAATAAGAVVGALVGDHMQNDSGSGQRTQRCRTVHDAQQRVTGYYVTYEFRGQTYTDVVSFRPSGQMRVRARLSPSMH